MRRATGLIGACIGAGLTYFLDPVSGRRRRAVFRDKTVCGVRQLAFGVELAARDLGHRAEGVAAETLASFDHQPPPNDVLIARVRSRIGRVLSHPRPVEVNADQGRVLLSGKILEHEHAQLLRAVRSVHGVNDVTDQLQCFPDARDNPELQGGHTPPGDVPDLFQRRWSPATRLILSVLGAAAFVRGRSRRGGTGAALSAGGATLAACALTNSSLAELVGYSEHGCVSIQKTINIEAPVDWVFKFWSEYGHFPEMMPHVRSVKLQESNVSHWKACAGPLNIPVTWHAIVTRVVSNERIEWKSVAPSRVQHAGSVLFERTPWSGTRMTLRMSYSPPLGLIGHVLASLLGFNLKRIIDRDFVAFKTRVELTELARQQPQSMESLPPVEAEPELEQDFMVSMNLRYDT
jgi:uncharacterized membrane protein